MTSVSTLGATQVAIQFDLNKSIDSAAQDVQAAISIAGKTLPQGMTIPPNYRKINPADPPILVLGARSETLPLTSINDYLDRFLAQQIAQVPGVSQAQIGGDRRPSIRIQVDPAKLAAIGLTLEEIRTTVVNSTTNAPKGTLYNFPPRGEVIISVAGYPAPARIGVQMYAQGIMCKMIAQCTQQGKSIDEAIAFGERELEGYMRT